VGLLQECPHHRHTAQLEEDVAEEEGVARVVIHEQHVEEEAVMLGDDCGGGDDVSRVCVWRREQRETHRGGAG